MHLKRIYVNFIDSVMSESIENNIAKVRESIARAAEKSGRNENDITIVAVSKRQPIEKIHEAKRAGIEIFGENRVQELLSKLPVFGTDFHWHMVGHLQGNKTNKVVGQVDLIQSVDSMNLVQKLSTLGKQSNLTIRILLQVNTSGESSKFGFPPEQVEDVCSEIEKFEFVVLEGLMTIGPLTKDKIRIEKSFARLRSVFEGLKKYNSNRINMTTLSMGMSDDYEIAIEQGSSLVRIGTAIFGQREII